MRIHNWEDDIQSIKIKAPAFFFYVCDVSPSSKGAGLHYAIPIAIFRFLTFPCGCLWQGNLNRLCSHTVGELKKLFLNNQK